MPLLVLYRDLFVLCFKRPDYVLTDSAQLSVSYVNKSDITQALIAAVYALTQHVYACRIAG